MLPRFTGWVALLLAPTCLAGEVKFTLTSTHISNVDEGEGLFITGDWPLPAAGVSFDSLKAVSVTAGCTNFDDNDVAGHHLIVFGAGGCHGFALPYLLSNRDSLPGTIVVAENADADAGMSNWAFDDEGGMDSYASIGSLLTVTNTWAAPLLHGDLAGATIHMETKLTPLALAEPIAAKVVLGHMSYYTFIADPDELSLTLTVTPTYGNPNLFVNTGAALSSTELPSLEAERTHTDPGDDALTMHLFDDRRAVKIGVYGESQAEYTLVLASTESTVPLVSGESKRFTVPAGEFRYFRADVPRGQGLDVSVTPLSGDPDLFVSLQMPRPDSSAPECAGAPSWCSSNAPARYEHVAISDGACPVATCPFYISVLAKGAPSTYAVVATWGGDPIRLVDGMPQAAQIASMGMQREYKTRVAGSHSDLSIALTNSYGSAHLYVKAGERATTSNHGWDTTTAATGDERLLIDIAQGSADFCVDCDYYILVVAQAATAYTITASSSHSVTALEDGAPINEVVNEGEYEYFKLFITAQQIEVQAVMTAFSGDPDMYLSVTNPYPNATDHTWSSTDAQGDLVTISTVDFGTYDIVTGESNHPSSPDLAACVEPPADSGASFSTNCVLYISVHGFKAASSFSLTASARVLSDGFDVLRPSDRGPYPFTISTFGATPGQDPQHSDIMGQVVRTVPHTACPPDGAPDTWVLTNHEEVNGKIALVERGRGPPGEEEECEFPHRYFANKVKRAQDANAIAVIMVNNVEGDGLVYMGATSGDHAASVDIPSIFVSYETGDELKRAIANDLTVSLSQPMNRLPMLVPGIPQTGAAAANQMKYYEMWTGPGHDSLTITVTPRFGNPDLYVTTSGGAYGDWMPMKTQFMWSSATEGFDSLTITYGELSEDGSAVACSDCRYYIGVLGGDVNVGDDSDDGVGAASTSFTIMVTIDETMLTLQSNVPLPSQEVALSAYKYYRFYVDREDQGITIAVTLNSGDADLFVSFDVEEPTAANSQLSAQGQVSCNEIDCGSSIANGDAVHIPALRVREFCPVLPCLAYIGVYGALMSNFNLLVTITDPETETPIPLSDGIEQAVPALNAGDYSYFSFYVGDSVQSLEIDVLSVSGDPDLYVICNDEAYPNRDNFDEYACAWRSYSPNGETLVIEPDGLTSCVACTYHIAVYAWGENTAFSVTVTTQAGTRMLRDGVPARSTVRAGSVGYFRYAVPVATTLQATVTPFSGDPSLFARFLVKPFNPDGRTSAAAQVAPYVSSESSGLEALTIDGHDANFCTTLQLQQGCVLYLAVRAEGAHNTTVSVLVQQRLTATTTLTDGTPQAGVVSARETRKYAISVPDMDHGLVVSFVSLMGNARLSGPLNSSLVDYADASKPTIRIAGHSGGGSYTFSVSSTDNAPANYSLVARTGRGVQLLQDHVGHRETLDPAQQVFYRVLAPAGAAEPLLLVAPYSGSVTVQVAPTDVRVADWATGVGTVDTYTATRAAPLALPLTPGTTNTVVVTSNFKLGVTTQRIDVNLTPILTPGEEVVLHNGEPQFRAAAKNEPVYFTYFAPAHNTYAISAVELDDPPDARLLMYVGRNMRPEEGGSVLVAEGEVGEIADLTIPDDYGCTANCLLYITVIPSQDADLSVTASYSASGQLTQLLPGQTVSGKAQYGETAQYVLKLDADDVKDDNLNVHLQVCTGRAHLYAGSMANPTAESGRHNYVSDADPPEPLTLNSLDLVGKSEYYVGVHGAAPSRSAADFQLKVLPVGEAPLFRSLLGDAGALKLSAGRDLTLRFEMLTVPCAVDALLKGSSAAACTASSKEVLVEPSSVNYEVHIVKSSPDGWLGSWCGIKKSKAWALANSTSLPSRVGSLKLDARRGKGTFTVKLPPALFQLTGGECAAGCLERGAEYMLTLAANHSNPASNEGVYRAVYQPVVFTLGGGGGGMSGGGVFFLLLFIAALLGLAYWGYLVHQGKRDAKEDIAAVVEKARMLAAAAADKIKNLDLSSLRPSSAGSSGDGPFVPLGARRARCEDTMNAPLTSTAAYVPPSQDTSGALPPLQAAPLPSAADASIAPLQLTVQVDTPAAAPPPPRAADVDE